MVIKKTPTFEGYSRQIKAGLLAVVLVAGVVFGLRAVNSSSSKDELSTPAPTPTVVAERFEAWTLTGLETRPIGADEPIVGAVISNAPDARPQSGLHQADIVFETIAEAGITRFIAFWQSEQPNNLGPIRSLRPYFSDFAMSFDAPLAHVGGSQEAIDEASGLPLKNLDQFFNGPSFTRTADRVAPHNVYTDFDRLNDLVEEIGYQPSEFLGYQFRDTIPPEGELIDDITVNFSSSQYNSNFVYRKQTNDYQRFIDGTAHLDRETGDPIATSNILVLSMGSSIDPDGRYRLTTVGSGSGTLFRSGAALPVTWQKDSRSGEFRFVDESGQPAVFQPGKIWISVLPLGKTVSY